MLETESELVPEPVCVALEVGVLSGVSEPVGVLDPVPDPVLEVESEPVDVRVWLGV